MTTRVIPISADKFHHEFKIALDGVTYTMAFRFNKRMDRWIMDMAESNGDMIVAGVPLLLGANLLKQFEDSRLPPGNMFVINVKDKYQDGSRDDMGENVILLYEEAA